MHSISLLIIFFCIQSLFVQANEPPPLSLAQRYHNNIPLDQYWISEKLDGVRAYWNGKTLISRQGNIIHAPDWFLKQLPKTPLDGELWLGRNQFEKTVSIIRKKIPIESEWRQLHYKVFDLPANNQIFDLRLQQLQQLLSNEQRVVTLIPHFKVASHEQLQEKLSLVIASGGEGLMLHRGSATYTAGRSNDLLKLKPIYDAEATVIAHRAGKGQFSGLMGSILVRLDNGKKFYIGSGFSKQQRKTPPPVGSVITFQHYGFSKKGTPRHASFLRIRSDHDL